MTPHPDTLAEWLTFTDSGPLLRHDGQTYLWYLSGVTVPRDIRFLKAGRYDRVRCELRHEWASGGVKRWFWHLLRVTPAGGWDWGNGAYIGREP
jgi:hypothetical protein